MAKAGRPRITSKTCVCKRCFGRFEVQRLNNGQWGSLPKYCSDCRILQQVRHPFIEFQGRRLYRDRQGWREGTWGGKGERLHRAMWIAAYGPIPEGRHLKYRDGNPDNNTLSNLVLTDGSRAGQRKPKRGSGRNVG